MFRCSTHVSLDANRHDTRRPQAFKHRQTLDTFCTASSIQHISNLSSRLDSLVLSEQDRSYTIGCRRAFNSMAYAAVQLGPSGSRQHCMSSYSARLPMPERSMCTLSAIYTLLNSTTSSKSQLDFGPRRSLILCRSARRASCALAVVCDNRQIMMIKSSSSSLSLSSLSYPCPHQLLARDPSYRSAAADDRIVGEG